MAILELACAPAPPPRISPIHFRRQQDTFLTSRRGGAGYWILAALLCVVVHDRAIPTARNNGFDHLEVRSHRLQRMAIHLAAAEYLHALH